jgi:hypothetical protein
MTGLRVKPMTQADLDDLKVCVSALSVVPNVGRASSPRSTDGLSISGSAHIIVPIDAPIANGIWEMMGMYKDHEKSAYPDVMVAERITLTINLFKVGKLLSTFYIANASISCWGPDKDFKVDFGSAAGKRISLIVDRLVQLLMFKRPIASNTADALTEM